MNALSISLLLVAAQTPIDFRDRERHPLAPSLPNLTKEESAKVEHIIERFILYDIGKLKGAEGKKALDDFNRLGPESTFQLIDGLNRAGNMESSCPAVIIAKKLASIFLSTEDTELLTFAKENIGAGVTAKRHLNVIKDLQFQCQIRKGTLQQRFAKTGKKSINVMTLAELEKSASRETGPALKAVLSEAARRPGVKATELLIAGIANTDSEVAKLSQGLLAANLLRQSAPTLKTMLRHEQREVRIAAAEVIGAKRLRVASELISLISDGDADVHQAARRALVQISGGLDHGPSANASADERVQAAERWRAWWSSQK